MVTEPPDADGASARGGIESALTELGFGAPLPIRVAETGAVRIPLVGMVDDRWPRRDGVPGKRPLW